MYEENQFAEQKPSKVAEKFEQYLEYGEYIIWDSGTGEDKGNIAAKAVNIAKKVYTLILSVIWIGTSLVWAITIYKFSGVRMLYMFFPFAAMAMLFFIRFFRGDSRRAKCVVTNKRIMHLVHGRLKAEHIENISMAISVSSKVIYFTEYTNENMQTVKTETKITGLSPEQAADLESLLKSECAKYPGNRYNNNYNY